MTFQTLIDDMKSRPRDLGTKMESRVVDACQAAGLIAERLAEGGSKDLGDVRLFADEEWILEVKDQMALNVPRALEKALQKSGTADTALVYRKMVRKDGNRNRTQDGPVVVALTLDRFLELVRGGVS